MKRRDVIKLILDTLTKLFVVFTVLKHLFTLPKWIKYSISCLAFATAFAYIVMLIVDRHQKKNESNAKTDNTVGVPADRFSKAKNVTYFFSVICLILFIPAWKGQLPLAGTIAASAVFLICLILQLLLKIINFRENRKILRMDDSE